MVLGDNWAFRGQTGRRRHSVSKVSSRLRRGIEASKSLQRVRRDIEEVRRRSGALREVSRASKGCPMTITPPSRSRRLDAMGVPGGRMVCRREVNSVKKEMVYGTRCTGLRTMEVGESIGGMEVCSGFP